MKEVKFLSIDEQYDHIKSKGLLFKNTKQSKLLLSSIGYYRLINGYKTIFTVIRDNVKTFDKDVYFENIHALYKFDIELKALIFQYALSIEIEIKSLLSNLLSHKYGVEEDVYLNENNFKNDEEEYNNFKNHFKRELNRQIRNEHPSMKHYKNDYNTVPFWVASNALSFGCVSRLFSLLRDPDAITIAKEFKLPFKILSSYLHHITLVRNICAHNDLLYCYKSINNLPQSDKRVADIYNKLNIQKNSFTGRYENGTNDFMATIIILKFLLSKSDFNEFKQKLKSLYKKLNTSISEKYYIKVITLMGVVDGWDML